MALGVGVLWGFYLFIFREFVFAKPFIISLVWVFTTLLMAIPFVHYFEVIPLVLSRFCFIFALSLGYDLVDMHYDADLQTPTLALHWGKKGVLLLAFFFLLLAAIAHTFSSYSYLEKIVQIIIFLLGACLLFWIKNKSKELSWQQVAWYKLGIDALLLG